MTKTTLFDQYHIDPFKVKDSRKWFDKKVEELSKAKITPDSLLNNAPRLTYAAVPGNLYFFRYDPRWKEELPYYDKFPMVFPFAYAQGGFLGLNLHYLEYRIRFLVFKELLKISGRTELNARSKMNFSWATVQQIAKAEQAKSCIKHYLYTHVRSPFYRVTPADWGSAMMLPVERFAKSTKHAIWVESGRHY